MRMSRIRYPGLFAPASLKRGYLAGDYKTTFTLSGAFRSGLIEACSGAALPRKLPFVIRGFSLRPH